MSMYPEEHGIRSITTSHLGDGSEPYFEVYENQAVIGRFPVNDPARPDARIRAREFATYPALLAERDRLREALETLVEFWDAGSAVHPGAEVVSDARAALAQKE